MDARQSKLLAAIIDQFIETAAPVGSKRLLETGSFHLSSATIRNEMSALEDQGFLEQPHVSAGRIPTAQGYKIYVQQHMEPSRHEKTVRQRFDQLREAYFQRKDQERVYDAVALLAHMVPNAAFATVPHKDRVYYMGLCNVLKQPECMADPALASGVAEVLEEHLTEVLNTMDLGDEIHYCIGECDILPKIHSCSLMARTYHMRGEQGVIGILGPIRMDYSYNTVALDLVTDLLHSYE